MKLIGIRKVDVFSEARKMHVKADAMSLADAIVKLDNMVKAANNFELKKRWKDFLFVYRTMPRK